MFAFTLGHNLIAVGGIHMGRISDDMMVVRPIFVTKSDTQYFLDLDTGRFQRGDQLEKYVLLGSIPKELYNKSLGLLEEQVSQVPGIRPSTSREDGRVDVPTEQLHYIFNVNKEGFTHTFEPGFHAIGLACSPANIASIGPNWIVFSKQYLGDNYDLRGITPALTIVTSAIKSVLYQPTSEERRIKFRV